MATEKKDEPVTTNAQGDGNDYDEKKSSGEWTASWPSPADFHFDYFKLLQKAEDRGIGTAPDSNKEQPKIAIIGAGSAGLTACRELVNCGFNDITLYEATGRIGGRHVSIPALASCSLTTYEMGAMRFPLFNNQSCAKHYIDRFDITHCPFPNPLSDYNTTGVFWNGTYYEHDPKKTHEPGSRPKFIKQITRKWNNFTKIFLDAVPKRNEQKDPKTGDYISFDYDESKFWDWWKEVIEVYAAVTFRGFALADKVEKGEGFPQKTESGDYKGLGCNQTQSSVLYTVGVGDGGWGAFFDICVLWVFRTMLFGYGTDLQQIIGRINEDGTVKTDGFYFESITDSREPVPNTINSPRHLGVESIDEGLFYLANGNGHVPYEKVTFYANSPVGNVHIFKEGVSKATQKVQIRVETDFHTKTYDHVIITTNVWSLPLDITQTLFENTSPHYPLTMMDALKDSHFILSSKVFYPLKRQYWDEKEMGKGKALPQVWSTDCLCQGVYAMCGNAYAINKESGNKSEDKKVAYEHDKGVVMLSYTWEGDASKLLQFSGHPKKFGKVCLNALDSLQRDTPGLNEKPLLSSCVDQSRPVAIHWGTEPFYGGCSKLYRAYTEKRNMCEIAWNQFYSAKTGLYFAGEGFSLDGGWTEPAMRLAIDAVYHIVKNTKNAEFKFKFDYPDWHYIEQSWYKSEIPLWKSEMKIRARMGRK